MATKTQPEIPVGMERIYRRFERWRKSHRGRLPIPAPLWAAAAEVAREHGVFRSCAGPPCTEIRNARLAHLYHRLLPQPCS